MDMSIPYETIGRTGQKLRTRNALIAATRQLLAQGVTPTVEQAAAEAAISRTTAYRYFPNQRALLVAAHPEIATPSLLGNDPPANVKDRLETVVAKFAGITVDTEPQLRTMLRLSLEPDMGHREKLLLRQGRAITWIEDALAPLRDRMSATQLRCLVLAIRSVVGIESLVWLTDIGQLSREHAVQIMRWSARALLQFALTHGTPQLSRPRPATTVTRRP
jgi:AcrR family transcriptional regulator